MERELLAARITDTARICERTATPRFLGFLSPAEAVLARERLAGTGCTYELFGGFEGAERVMLGCFPEWAAEHEFPIIPLTFTYRRADKLGHRDFLGSITALGLKREAVGDILSEPGRTVVFVTAEIADFIITQLCKVGRVGVTVTSGAEKPLPAGDTPIELSTVAASERLDCLTAAICGLSRSRALEMIAAGYVTVNSSVAEKPSKSLCAGDVLSVRGKGRFVIDSLDGRTKKNRIAVKYKSYIQEEKRC